MRCLRSLGLAYTGQPHKEAEAKRLGAGGVAIVDKMMQHPRIAAVLKELQLRATHRRRTKLALEEGRAPPKPLRKPGDKVKEKPKKERRGPPLGSAIHMGDGAVFVASLSGEVPDGVNAPPLVRAAASRPAKRQRRENSEGNGIYGNGGSSGASLTSKTGSAQKMKPKREKLSNERNDDNGRGKKPSTERANAQHKGKADAGTAATAVGDAGGDELHGSWAARRQQKAKEAAAVSAFAGKRITFDDSD
eukprot:TRINITY_DN2623_c0_g1_i1.p1 TRINITY_DN2623_c0_g1~~TRINITY_DN2623_c0_g1_i1.p1  ORF type:complete len:248 (+),score=67.75 TRINITY_DN2623_c0_g1_i1:1121-1864(+)